MKILQVGSDSVHVSSYISALREREEELYLLAEERCVFAGIRKEYSISFRSLNPLSVAASNAALKELLKELKPDVIHIHQVNRLAFFVSRAAKKLKIPVVTTAWGSDVLLIPQKNRFFRYLVTKTLKRSNVITADSKEMIAAMRTLYPKGNYVLLQYGIDPVLPGIKEKVIYSNRLHTPLYRIDVIIRYFKGFIAVHPEWKLVVGATGIETENLKQLVRDSGLTENVQFVGWLNKEQNNEWYAKSCIYISIPESDGTSVSVLESMSAGCVPVVSNLEVSHEWIESGKNGVIEKQGSNPLEEALLIDIDKCREINRKLIDEKATRVASINTFIKLYQKAIGK